MYHYQNHKIVEFYSPIMGPVSMFGISSNRSIDTVQVAPNLITPLIQVGNVNLSKAESQ